MQEGGCTYTYTYYARSLVPLLTSTFQKPDINTAIEQAQEQREREAQQ